MQAEHFVSLEDVSKADVEEIFETTADLKRHLRAGENIRCLPGKVLGMVFEKYSMRTRVSFEVAMTQLGGSAIFLTDRDINLGERESVKDGATVLSRYVDGIVSRTYSHDVAVELAEHATVPVVNGLSDYCHPCQGLCDLYTIKEKLGALDGVKLAYVGDGNNVARSLFILCSKLGVHIVVAAPEGYRLRQDFVEKIAAAAEPGFTYVLTDDPAAAVQNADVVYTDTWISMGQEEEAEARKSAFGPYQVNAELMRRAPSKALVMHCLPAHRGYEITDEVIDGPNSVVLDQAENRLHSQKGLLRLLMGPSARA